MDRSAPKHAPLSAFVDVEDDTPLPALDRSTAERYGNCPASGRIVDLGLVPTANDCTNSGNEVHACLSTLIDLYVDARGEMSVPEMVDTLTGEMHKSRPDVQPDVIDALKYSIWPFCRFLDEIGSARIVRYDGGRAEKSGQLSHNIPSLGVCYTSELDLLYMGPSKKILHEIDYKSGYLKHTAKTIAASFQFQSHAFLVFKNYPDVDVLEVSIWHTRNNSIAYTVEFHRKDLPQFEARIYRSAMEWKAWHKADLAIVPPWPSAEKCRICDGRTLCPIKPPAACADDPAGYVTAMLALSAKLEAMRDEAIEHVEATGADIVTPDGIAFGFSKPIERKPKAALYDTVPGSDAPAVTREPKQRKSKSSKPAREVSTPDDDALFEQAIANLTRTE